MRTFLVEGSYLFSSVLFILGLKSLTKPDQARRGMQLAAFGMLVAIVGTLLQQEIVSYGWIMAGLAVGMVLGYPLGKWVPMTAMPQRIAFSHMFGAMAATFVGIAEFHTLYHVHLGAVAPARMAALGFEVLFGSLTITGSFMACGKLQGFITGRPVTFKGQNALNLSIFAVAVLLFLYSIPHPSQWIFYTMIGLATFFGAAMVVPIGGADMPVVISLLNSYAGLASAATGFAIGNSVLIIAGALDGGSGFLLSILMSKAMNRSFGNVLFGAFGATPEGGPKAAADGKGHVNPISVEDAALRLGYARSVVIVPGYGMAVAQCQHQVRELTDLLEKRGGEVKFAIHPVAGRMPGHMNVLLAEADIAYHRLRDMEEINPEFPRTDIALVIGANDVVNPAAKEQPSSPIYGMPILDVDQARQIIVMKRGMNPGFAGIENELFHKEKTSMLFGDAKKSLAALIGEVKNL